MAIYVHAKSGERVRAHPDSPAGRYMEARESWTRQDASRTARGKAPARQRLAKQQSRTVPARRPRPEAPNTATTGTPDTAGGSGADPE